SADGVIKWNGTLQNPSFEGFACGKHLFYICSGIDSCPNEPSPQSVWAFEQEKARQRTQPVLRRVAIELPNTLGVARREEIVDGGSDLGLATNLASEAHAIREPGEIARVRQQIEVDPRLTEIRGLYPNSASGIRLIDANSQRGERSTECMP